MNYTLLVEKYDAEHTLLVLPTPIELFKHLMKDLKMKALDLAKLLRVSEGLASDMLHGKVW